LDKGEDVMAIVSGIKFQAKIGEVNELEDGLKEYVSLAKKVGSTMALIRAASGPAGVFWTLTLYETPGELDSTREKIVASDAGTAFQAAAKHLSTAPEFTLARQLRAVDTTAPATVLNGMTLTAQKGKIPQLLAAVANLEDVDRGLGHNSGSMIVTTGTMGRIILLTRCVDSDEYQSVVESRLGSDTSRMTWRNVIDLVEGPPHVQLGRIVTSIRD
tara:strand:- start:664 stop:1311 length:648 start_codon:yes stop_codon:yes gene_type:complete